MALRQLRPDIYNAGDLPSTPGLAVCAERAATATPTARKPGQVVHGVLAGHRGRSAPYSAAMASLRWQPHTTARLCGPLGA